MRTSLKKLVASISLGIALISLMSIISPAIFVSAATTPQVVVTVNANKTISTNNMTIGFMLHTDLSDFKSSNVEKQLVKNASFTLVRFFDKILGPSDYSKGVGPCSYWNETSQTGTFDWTKVDPLVNDLLALGCEPMITLSQWRPKDDVNGWKSAFPPGMAINSTTQLPYPKSYAAFAAAWVQHFKTVGLPVRYFEIFNEPQTYIGWSPPGDVKRIGYFVDLFNAAYTKMHSVNSNVMVSTDASLELHFWNYFIQKGVGIDFLDFHKYDAWAYPQFTDDEMLTKAEQKYFVTDYTAISIADAKQQWYSKHGKILPAILGEGNFNAAWQNGTDPRIQKMVGTVRTALVLRMGMLNGMSCDVYYRLSSSLSFERSEPTGGQGFGMVNSDNDQPWYPYYLLKMVNTNMGVGDKIIESTANNTNDFRTIAWIHNGKVNLLVIGKRAQAYNVKVQGLSGNVTYEKLDDTISWQTPKVQTGQYSSSLAFTGFAVALFRGDAGSAPPPPPPPPPPTQNSTFEDGFESGSFSKWTGTQDSSGEAQSVVTSPRHHGTYSAKFTSNGNGGYERAYCYVNIASTDELYARSYVYMNKSGIADNDDKAFFIKIQAGSDIVAYAGWKRTNGAVKWQLVIRDGTGYSTVYSSSSPTTGRWYSLEIHWKKNTTSGLAELWVDGTLTCSIAGKNTANYGSATQVGFGLTEIYNCASTILYTDCEKISKTYIGPESA